MNIEFHISTYSHEASYINFIARLPFDLDIKKGDSVSLWSFGKYLEPGMLYCPDDQGDFMSWEDADLDEVEVTERRVFLTEDGQPATVIYCDRV